MTTDLMMLAWSAALCALLWVPYILARIGAWGLVDTVGYPDSPPDVPVWSARIKKAHANLVEKIGRASLGKECRSRWSPYH